MTNETEAKILYSQTCLLDGQINVNEIHH